MKDSLTLQTAAAFERIYDALMGKTTDDLSSLILHLEELSRKGKEIKDISASLISGNYENTVTVQEVSHQTLQTPS